MKPAVLTEEHAEHLGNSEDELSVGEVLEKLLVHVRTKQKRPFLGEGQRRCSGTPKGWKTLQPKGRKYSTLQVGLVH